MSSLVLLAIVSCLLAIPGVPASLLIFDSRPASAVTRLAAAFGLGYTVAAGCAFALAAAHEFWLGVYLVIWGAISLALWFWAVLRASLREQLRSIRADIGQHKIILAAGTLVIAALVLLHLRYLGVLNGSRYIYYLNGIEIANSHGVPKATLEYGQSWPPATDKIYLDAFTGVLVLLNPNVAVGPAIMLLVSLFGAAVGLWASAWELGLRRFGVLVPVVYLGNELILDRRVSVAFTSYRAEDFGRAVAFCALAVGIAAIRQKGWRLAVGAGAILAAASGTHLIPVVYVALALAIFGIAEVAFGERGSPRWYLPLARGLALAAVAGTGGVVIRYFAGGSFGLQGAQGSASYASLHMPFDPTAYLYGGLMYPSSVPSSSYWYAQPNQVIQTMVMGNSSFPGWEIWIGLGVPVVAAVLLFLMAEFRHVALTGLGTMVGLVVAGVVFAVTYHFYIEQTFGIRRLSAYVSLAYLLLIAGVLEAGGAILARRMPRLSVVVSLAVVIGLSAWLLPSTAMTSDASFYGHERTGLVNWVRTSTPCNARFLINQRTEGVFTALTGRFSLIEGMGPFLRTQRLPYVVDLVHGAKMFFRAAPKREQYLLRHDISYVVVVTGFQELGYQAPIGPTNMKKMRQASFLRLVYSSKSIKVYKVTAVNTAKVPASPLLRGPYLHCMTAPLG